MIEEQVVERRATTAWMRDRVILFVDDDPTERQLLKERLHSYPLEVLLAADGQEALQSLESHEVDAVVVDLWMPGMTGITLMEELKRQHPQVPVMALTSLHSDEVLFMSLERGCRGFLEKPYDVRDLLQQLRAIMKA